MLHCIAVSDRPSPALPSSGLAAAVERRTCLGQNTRNPIDRCMTVLRCIPTCFCLSTFRQCCTYSVYGRSTGCVQLGPGAAGPEHLLRELYRGCSLTTVIDIFCFRNAALSEGQTPATGGAPHQAPTHPTPPACPAAADQSILPHSTYPARPSPSRSPLSPARPSPSRSPLSPTQARPPPYVPPPSGRLRAMTSQATQVEGGARPADPLNTSLSSSTTEGSRTEAGSSSWMEWTQQLQVSYIQQPILVFKLNYL